DSLLEGDEGVDANFANPRNGQVHDAWFVGRRWRGGGDDRCDRLRFRGQRNADDREGGMRLEKLEAAFDLVDLARDALELLLDREHVRNVTRLVHELLKACTRRFEIHQANI